MKYFFVFVLGAVVAWIVITQVPAALDKEAEIKCRQYQEYAHDYPAFYLTPSEKTMCDSVGVEVDAPISGELEGE